MSVLELRRVPLDDPLAAPLVRDLEQDLRVRYDNPGAPGKPLDPAAFLPPHGAFLVGLADGVGVACGGVRTHEPGVGEIKRMWVDRSARGQGHARTVLAALEQAARELDLSRLLLETGTAQPEAVALYASSGWHRVEPYGEWRHAPEIVCFGKQL